MRFRIANNHLLNLKSASTTTRSTLTLSLSSRLRAMSSSSSTSAQELSSQIESLGDKVRQLKSSKAPAEEIKSSVDELLSLKSKLSILNGQDPNNTNHNKKKVEKFVLKTPKGTRDWEPLSMRLRAQIFDSVTKVFESHGAVTIDTPVFERKEILSGKYGEDSKLIYDLQDQGGELCSLRYDLTVPFARFVAMNQSEYGNIKRYHIAKVYRRDQPAMSKGRFREFYQCDFDIAGVYDPMLPDAEILCILVEALNSLQLDGGFKIKLNHRKILDGIFALCGVPQEKIRTISSAVDKLDKSPWEVVKKEMCVEKGLEEEVADKIGEYVKLKGGKELLEKLQADPALSKQPIAAEGIKDMALLFGYLDTLDVTSYMSFDLSLARGLDYYTGIIYEAITEASAPPGFSEGETPTSTETSTSSKSKSKKKTIVGEDGEEEIDESKVGVGSIAAGGRYDNLVGMFSGSKKPDAVPCVGVSIGVERVFALKMAQLKEKLSKGDTSGVRAKSVQVFVMSMGDGMVMERMKICKALWDAGIKAEFLYKTKPKPAAQFAAVDKDGVPLAVLLAPEEWKSGEVRVKEQRGRDSEEGTGKGEVVKVEELVNYLKKKIQEGSF